MNINDIDLASESVIDIVNLVTMLYEVYKKGMTKEKLIQLWDIIASDTQKNVNDFNNAVKEMPK